MTVVVRPDPQRIVVTAPVVSGVTVTSPVTDLVVIRPQPQVIVVTDTVISGVTVTAPGPQGPPGPAGAGPTTWVHEQVSPAAAWIIAHNLGRYPSTVVLDTAGNEVLSDVIHTRPNSLTVVFAAPASGSAHLGT